MRHLPMLSAVPACMAKITTSRTRRLQLVNPLVHRHETGINLRDEKPHAVRDKIRNSVGLFQGRTKVRESVTGYTDWLLTDRFRACVSVSGGSMGSAIE